MAMAEAPLSTQAAQLTNTLLMVSPDQFGFNAQTAATNSFQNPTNESPTIVRDRAFTEFSKTVAALRHHGVEVVVCPSRVGVLTPDAVFPNNWISFHTELLQWDIVLYPMLAPNRRAERQFDRVKSLMPWMAIDPQRVLDLTHLEQAGQFLEGTGSLVFQRSNKVVFAHESARTSSSALDVFCQETGYRPVRFHAFDRQDRPIYHTNVVMGIGEGFSVVCLESIRDQAERHRVESQLDKLGLEVIGITLDQLHSFCGNVLHVASSTGPPKIILSDNAFAAFTEEQRRRLIAYGELIPVDINTIETVGGGSARCLVAEVFPGKA